MNHILITGGTKGLGRQLALTFAKANYFVTALYHSDLEAAASLRTEFSANGFHGETIHCDISSEALTPILQESIKKQGAPKLILINNAAANFEPKPAHLQSAVELDQQLSTSVRGSFIASQAVIPFMLRQKAGTVVNILSKVISTPPKGFLAYTTAKFALQGMTQALAAEYNAKGIRVFSVSPGLMKTSFTDAWPPILFSMVLGANGTPESPESVANQVLQFVEDSKVPGNGENYFTDPEVL